MTMFYMVHMGQKLFVRPAFGLSRASCVYKSMLES